MTECLTKPAFRNAARSHRLIPPVLGPQGADKRCAQACVRGRDGNRGVHRPSSGRAPKSLIKRCPTLCRAEPWPVVPAGGASVDPCRRLGLCRRCSLREPCRAPSPVIRGSALGPLCFSNHRGLRHAASSTDVALCRQAWGELVSSVFSRWRITCNHERRDQGQLPARWVPPQATNDQVSNRSQVLAFLRARRREKAMERLTGAPALFCA